MITANNRNELISPAIFFTFDASKSGFSRNCILDTLQGESINAEIFQEFVIRNVEKKENLAKGVNDNFGSDENKFLNQYSNNLSNAEILEQQRHEMERILREEEKLKRLKAEEEKRIQKEVFKFFIIYKNLQNKQINFYLINSFEFNLF